MKILPMAQLKLKGNKKRQHIQKANLNSLISAVCFGFDTLSSIAPIKKTKTI
jgi:hypothetical protein